MSSTDRRTAQRPVRLTAAAVCALAAWPGAAAPAGEPADPARGPVQPAAPLPFTAGDVFIGATYLDDPDDDHAGRGRVLQYDADLNLKRVIWLADTTHLISGLSFAPDGTLWGSDLWAWRTVRIAPEGRQLETRQYAERPLSSLQFLDDGTLLIAEAMAGENQPETLSTRHPPLPGEKTRFGDGGIYRFDADGMLLDVHDPDIDGGVTGSFAVNHSVLSADRRSLIYVSETGPRLMRYDFIAKQQLADIPRNTELQPQMHFALASLSGGRLLISMGNRLDLISEAGEELRVYPLEGFGWSVLSLSPDERFAYVGNWYDGSFVKLDLADGEVEQQITVCVKCMASSAVYAGSVDAARVE